MNTRRINWKLYLFFGAAGAILFRIPPTDTAALILWTLGVYGGMMLWMMDQHARSPERLPRDDADEAISGQPQVAEARSNGHHSLGIAVERDSYLHQVPEADAGSVGIERN